MYTDPDTAKTTKTKRVIKRLTGERKTNKSTKENDYEVQFKAPHDGDDCKHFYGYKKLVKWGWDKACKKVDVKVAQAASGMFRPLTSSNVESHLKNVGLDAEFATHHRISALSGGQKVKVVLGAAMWMQPHLVILDEPTNYLDRESLGALADAIREFEGGVVIISHNNDFTTALCPETWVVEKDDDEISRPNCRGDPEWMKNALATKCDDQQAITEVTDAYGNVRTRACLLCRLARKRLTLAGHGDQTEENSDEKGNQEADQGDQGQDQVRGGARRGRGGVCGGARALEVEAYLYGALPHALTLSHVSKVIDTYLPGSGADRPERSSPGERVRVDRRTPNPGLCDLIL